MLLDAWSDACDHKHTGHKNGPQSDVQHILVECRLRRRTDRGKHHEQYNIPAPPVILVNGLSLIHAPEHKLWHVELREAHEGLNKDQNICYEPHDPMDACKASLGVRGFIHLNNHKTCYEGRHAHEIQRRVDISALDLVFLGGRGLQNKDTLCEEQETGRVQEWMNIEKDDFVLEDSSPDLVPHKYR